MTLPDLSVIGPWGTLIATLALGLWRISSAIAEDRAHNEARHDRTEQAFQSQVLQSRMRHEAHDNDIREIAGAIKALADAMHQRAEMSAAEHASLAARVGAHDQQIERMLNRLERATSP